MWVLLLLGYLYLAGACIVACRLGWYMAFHLDARARRRARPPVWQAFLRSVLLWPVIVMLGPRELIDPSGILGVAGIGSDFSESDDANEYRVDSTGLTSQCGFYIRFRPAASLRQAAAGGEFVFRSDDVAGWLNRRLVVDPDRLPEGDIQQWIDTRDGRIIEPTDVPSTASRFEFIADEMVRMGFGEVRCRRCNAQIPHEALIYSDDDGNQMSWNFNRILCPQRHPLLLVGMVHVNIDFDDWVSAQGDGSDKGPASAGRD